MQDTPTPEKVCAYCYTPFKPKRKTQKFCTREHQVAFWQEAYHRAAAAHKPPTAA